MRWFDGIGCLVTAALIAATVSCDSVTRPVMPGQYATPEATLQTLAKAIGASGQPTLRILEHAIRAPATLYLSCFADSTSPATPAYHHYFDPADVTAFESVCGCPAPVDWGISQELAFYRHFIEIRPSDKLAMVFNAMPALPDLPATGTEAILHRRYRVVAVGPDGAARIIAIGSADLTFVRDPDGRWIIVRWDDHGGPAEGAPPVDPDHVTLGRRRLDSTR